MDPNALLIALFCKALHVGFIKIFTGGCYGAVSFISEFVGGVDSGSPNSLSANG